MAGFIFLVFTFLGVLFYPTPPVQRPVRNYLFYVVCESADKIVRLRFGPEGLRIEHEVRIGIFPTDINGPHGIAMSPDKQFYYVSVAHGRPFGSIWKYKAGADSLVSYTGLGLFLATVDVTHDGNFAYTVNANFEAKRIQTCTVECTTFGLTITCCLSATMVEVAEYWISRESCAAIYTDRGAKLGACGLDTLKGIAQTSR